MFVRKKKETANEGLSLTPGVSVLEMEKGTVLFDGGQGWYFRFNKLGLIVVKSLGEAMGVDAIVRRVIETYDADAKMVDIDVGILLARIKELGVTA